MNRLCAGVFFWFLSLASSWVLAADSPDTLVENTSQQMLAALNQDRAMLQRNPGKIYDLVDDILLPHFDFATMSRWVLGKYWRQATPEQRERFVSDFRTLLVNTYSKALLEYSNEKINVLPSPTAPDSDDVTVRTEVLTSGQSVPINYRLHRKNGEWKVYDVTVDGISLVTNYRSTIGTQIRNEGMEAMLEKLRAGKFKS